MPALRSNLKPGPHTYLYMVAYASQPYGLFYSSSVPNNDSQGKCPNSLLSSSTCPLALHLYRPIQLPHQHIP